MSDIYTYLAPQGRYFTDNFFMGNCDENTLQFVSDFVQKHFQGSDSSKALLLCIDSNVQKYFSNAVSNLKSLDMDKSLLATLFVDSLVLRGVYAMEDKKELLSALENTLQSLVGDFNREDFVNFYVNFPSKLEISEMMRQADIYDLDVILPDVIEDNALQSAINDYIFQHLPFCVKVFSSTERLYHPYTTSGHPVQSVHDYSYIDAKELNQDISL